MIVHRTVAGDLDVAAGGDGALGFAFHAFVGVGLVNAGVVRSVAVVDALVWGGGAGFYSAIFIVSIAYVPSKIIVFITKNNID